MLNKYSKKFLNAQCKETVCGPSYMIMYLRSFVLTAWSWLFTGGWLQGRALWYERDHALQNALKQRNKTAHGNNTWAPSNRRKGPSHRENNCSQILIAVCIHFVCSFSVISLFVTKIYYLNQMIQNLVLIKIMYAIF